jgi:hypothetical protein
MESQPLPLFFDVIIKCENSTSKHTARVLTRKHTGTGLERSKETKIEARRYFAEERVPSYLINDKVRFYICRVLEPSGCRPGLQGRAAGRNVDEYGGCPLSAHRPSAHVEAKFKGFGVQLEKITRHPVFDGGQQRGGLDQTGEAHQGAQHADVKDDGLADLGHDFTVFAGVGSAVRELP